jgi:hypothetical protein
LDEILTYVVLGALLIGVLALNFFINLRRSMKAPFGRVALILADVNRNESMVENFGYHRGVGKMKTGAWKKNKGRVDFLSQELRMELSQLFDMVEDVNARINTARNFKSDSYMAGIDVSKLKGPLARSKQQLQEWLQENVQNPDYQPKRRRSLFG